MSNDDERLVGAAGHDGYDVAELDGPELGEVLGPDVFLRRETERRNGLAVPESRASRALRAGNP